MVIYHNSRYNYNNNSRYNYNNNSRYNYNNNSRYNYNNNSRYNYNNNSRYNYNNKRDDSRTQRWDNRGKDRARDKQQAAQTRHKRGRELQRQEADNNRTS